MKSSLPKGSNGFFYFIYDRMILCSLDDSERIESLHPSFPELFHFLHTHELSAIQEDQIRLRGDELFINNSRTSCVQASEQMLEVHRCYLDVHILLEGEETIGWKATSQIQHFCQAYDSEKDAAFSDEKPSTYVTLHPGEILIAYPEDAHAPLIGEGMLHKLIAKVLLP